MSDTKSRQWRACPRVSGTTSHERRACHRLSDTRNQIGGNSSIRYEVMRKESLSLSIQYEKSSRWNFTRSIRSRRKGGLVLIRQVRRIMQAGLRPFGTTSREWRACPTLSGTRNQAGRTTSIWYEVERKEDLSSSVQYEESSRLHFVCLVRSHTKGELFLVLSVQGMK